MRLKIGAALLAALLVVGAVPALAQETEPVTVPVADCEDLSERLRGVGAPRSDTGRFGGWGTGGWKRDGSPIYEPADIADFRWETPTGGTIRAVAFGPGGLATLSDGECAVLADGQGWQRVGS